MIGCKAINFDIKDYCWVGFFTSNMNFTLISQFISNLFLRQYRKCKHIFWDSKEGNLFCLQNVFLILEFLQSSSSLLFLLYCCLMEIDEPFSILEELFLFGQSLGDQNGLWIVHLPLWRTKTLFDIVQQLIVLSYKKPYNDSIALGLHWDSWQTFAEGEEHSRRNDWKRFEPL